MRIDQPLVVDVAESNMLSVIKAKQRDVNSRFLKIKLVNKGEPIAIGENERVVLGGKRPDGVVKGYEGTVENNIITFDISWFIKLEGRVVAEITIINTKNQEKLSSFPFLIRVQENIYNDEEIIKDPNYDLLLSLITDVETIKKEIEDALANGDFQGATFVPNIDENGILTWTNDKGLPNPEPFNMQGVEGKSAYQVAVDNGFVGTEQEWLESLKGKGTTIGKIELTVPAPPSESYLTTMPKPSEIIEKFNDIEEKGELVYLTDEIGFIYYTPLNADTFSKKAIFYNVQSISDTKLKIELINLDGNTEKVTREIKEYNIPNINDNVTNSSETWSSQKITDELNRPQHNTMRITATKNPLGSGYISDYSSSEIKNWVDAGGDAELYFEDTIEGSGEQIYHYIKFQNRTAYFRRNVLTEGEVRQIDIEIYERNIKFTDLRQKFATPDDIQMLEDSKANYTHKVIATDKVSQLDATEVLTYVDQYDGKLIEFLTNGENPSKAVATGRVFTTTQGDAYLITYNLDGTTTVWNKENYEKHQIETSSLINAGLIDVDNLTVDIQGDAPHLYSVRDAMNTPNSIKGDGCVFVLPHSLNKQIQYYIDMTSGKQWYRLVTGSPDAHSFDVWKEMGGSSKPSGEVWEDVISMYTIDTASNQVLVPVETTKHYKKLKIIYKNNIAETRKDSYSLQPYALALTSTTHTDEPLPLAMFNADTTKSNPSSLMYANGYLISLIDLIDKNIYITKTFTKATISDIANPKTHSDSIFDDNGLLTGIILFTPADTFTDGFVAGGTIEVKGVAI